jgi:hypothetical protein
MIGEIPKLGVQLNDDGVWEGPEFTTVALNTYYKPGTLGGVEAIFPYGQHAVVMAAAKHKLNYVLTEKLEPLPEDAVS